MSKSGTREAIYNFPLVPQAQVNCHEDDVPLAVCIAFAKGKDARPNVDDCIAVLKILKQDYEETENLSNINAVITFLVECCDKTIDYARTSRAEFRKIVVDNLGRKIELLESAKENVRVDQAVDFLIEWSRLIQMISYKARRRRMAA